MVDDKKKTIHRFLTSDIVVSEKFQKYIFWGVMVCFVIIATIMSYSYSRDSDNYNMMFEVYGASGWDGFNTEIFKQELFILAVSKMVYKLGLDSIYLFLFFAAISLTVKFHLIYKYSKDRILSLAFFGSYFFILHDSTQIRFGMAVAFVYLGLSFLAENRKLLFSAIVIFSAILFHHAILIFILMLFFTSQRSSLWIIGMSAVAVLFYPINYNELMLDLVHDVIKFFDAQETRLKTLFLYLLRPNPDVYLGLFTRRAILVYFCAIVIFQYRKIFNAYELLCYNALLLSIFFYIFLKDAVELQVRASAMFGFSLVFLVPYVHRGLSDYIGERMAYIILLSFFAVYLIKFTLYDKMLIL